MRVRDAEHRFRLPPGAVRIVAPPGTEPTTKRRGDHGRPARNDVLDRSLHRVGVHIEELPDLAGDEALLREVERAVDLRLGERRVRSVARGSEQDVKRCDGHRIPFRWHCTR